MLKAALWAFQVAAAVAVITASDTGKSKKLSDVIQRSIPVKGVSRLLDESAMIGGNTQKDGDVGILYLIDGLVGRTVADFMSAPLDNYVVLLAESVLQQPGTYKNLTDSKKLKGVLLYDDQKDPASVTFSPGGCNPNAKNGIPLRNTMGNIDANGNTLLWNDPAYDPNTKTTTKCVAGSAEFAGLHWEDLGIGFFYVSEHEDLYGVNGLVNTTLSTNFKDGTQNVDHYPLQGVRLTFFNWGAPDAVTCLRRGYCDGIGGQTVLGFLRPYTTGDPVVMVAAASDAVAMFHDDAYGLGANGASVVTVLAAAKYVGELSPAIRKNNSYSSNILFTLFAGETFGYTGSSSFGQRMKKTATVPALGAQLQDTDLKYYIEVDQVMAHGKIDGVYYGHYDKPNADDDEPNEATAAAQSAFQTVMGEEKFLTPVNGEMPPSSFRGLFNELPTQRTKVGALVISNYEHQYENKLFNSQWDTANAYNISENTDESDQYVAQLCALAKSVAKGAMKLANVLEKDFPADDKIVDLCRYVADLIKVVGVDRAMSAGDDTVKIGSLFMPSDDATVKYPMSRYVGVFAPGAITLHEQNFFFQMAYALRDRDISNTTFPVQGQYCSIVKGKNKCSGVDGTGDGTTWTADVNSMYTACLGQQNSHNVTAPKVSYGASTAQTGRTSITCTKKQKKGKGDDAPDECKDVSKDDDFVNVDSKYTAAASWNWVQTYPGNRANCPDGVCLAVCMYSSVAWMDAPSPAFAADWYHLGDRTGDPDKRWSTWTESTWDKDPTLEAFLVASPKSDNAILGGGIGYFIVSFMVVWFLNKRISAIEEPTY